MKKLLLLITIALTFSCVKKENDPKPADQQQIENPDMVKVTVWSNRVNYTYRRKKLRSDWKEDLVTSKTAVFYEEYCDCMDGSLKYTEYAMLATHKLSKVKGDSISILIQYKGKKAYNLNVSGNTFALTKMIDLK
ncbi:MAG: hypothetical protein VKL60_20835 [Sphaerospermopsis sp.]|nr:hypothetical protein [Sphaerospermopsis sp.]